MTEYGSIDNLYEKYAGKIENKDKEYGDKIFKNFIIINCDDAEKRKRMEKLIQYLSKYSDNSRLRIFNGDMLEKIC